MVVDGAYPADIRVRKEAEHLAQEFKVSVLCVSSGNDAEYEEIKGVHVHRLLSYKSKNQRARLDMLNALTGKHPLFSRALHNIARQEKIHAVHVHDLALASTVLKVAKKYPWRRVLDLHENYPEALQIWFQWRKSPVVRIKNRLFFQYSHWKKREKKMIQSYDYIITVIEKMKKFLLSHHPVSPEKILVIENTEGTGFRRKIDESHLPDLWEEFKGDFIISYIGGIGPHRGIQTLIEALPEIKRHIPEVKLLIAGSGHPDVLDKLRQLSVENNTEDIVYFIGQRDFREVPAMMRASSVNIIPHIEHPHTNNTVPHKLYQIMLTGAPLLVSDVASMKNIVEPTGIGFSFKAGDPHDLAEKVLYIYRHPEEVQHKAQAALQAASQGELSREKTDRKLLDFYRKLFRS